MHYIYCHYIPVAQTVEHGQLGQGLVFDSQGAHDELTDKKVQLVLNSM